MPRRTLLYLALLTVHLAPVARAGATPPLLDYPGCPYVSGAALAAANEGVVQLERGRFVTVPLDYADASRGTTRVYAYFAQPYDPARPTYLYFRGGPGGNVHFEETAQYHFSTSLGWNLLLVEERGAGFSRFATESEARDARNYGVEAAARDAAAVLAELGIAKVSVYGVSFGTVPATIFASLFPEKTRALVLEGVVFEGWSGSPQSGNEKLRLVERFLQSLQPRTRERLLFAIREGKLLVDWVPLVALGMDSESGTLKLSALREAIEFTLYKYKELSQALIEKELEKLLPPLEVDSMQLKFGRGAQVVELPKNSDPCLQLRSSSLDTNAVVHIKEFGAAKPKVALGWGLIDGAFRPQPAPTYTSKIPLYINLVSTGREYSAARYPVAAPTYYLQGELDASTPASGAELHFRRVARGPAQKLVFTGSSHVPSMNYLLADGEPEPMRELFRKALAGKALPEEELRAMSEQRFGQAKLESKNLKSGQNTD